MKKNRKLKPKASPVGMCDKCKSEKLSFSVPMNGDGKDPHYLVKCLSCGWRWRQATKDTDHAVVGRRQNASGVWLMTVAGRS